MSEENDIQIISDETVVEEPVVEEPVVEEPVVEEPVVEEPVVEEPVVEEPVVEEPVVEEPVVNVEVVSTCNIIVDPGCEVIETDVGTIPESEVKIEKTPYNAFQQFFFKYLGRRYF